jgi:multiple sugar transport system ATP-binding protein
VHAVRELSFEVKDKELLVLAGPSGCGKTTTLRLIAGLESPTAGSISIDGRIVTNVPAKDRDVAMVFQNLALYPHMSARENIEFGLKARKHSKQEIASRVDETIATLHLADCVDRQPGEMSGGQRQRVALARAFALQPKLLLLDEPLSNLDGPLRIRMRLELSRLHRTLGITIIYVTHDQVDAMSLAKRLVIMNVGTLRQIAEPITVYRAPADAFVAGFLGMPGMNFFKGNIVSGSGTTSFLEQGKGAGAEPQSQINPLKIELPAENAAALKGLIGKAVVLGVRPEDITFAAENAVNSVEAVIEKIECLGSEVHIHCRTAAHQVVVRQMASVSDTLNEGTKVRFGFNIRSAHFFDAATGAKLG